MIIPSGGALEANLCSGYFGAARGIRSGLGGRKPELKIWSAEGLVLRPKAAVTSST